ncbi:MAG: hypothetical protein J6K48_06870 [Lachnospiraceae bacterium]|nr:hypothetical protein [Lachnospiraceae bacterium]
MKIRIAICTEENIYAERLIRYFNIHYYDKFSWDMYTEPDYLLHTFQADKTDILLLGEEIKNKMDVDSLDHLGDCLIAYLVEQVSDEALEAGYEIAKYRRADEIYRDLLEIYSHKNNIRYTNAMLVDSKTELYAFVAPCGGVGTSTVAIAAAKRFAKTETVLYLNLENISGTGLIFQREDNKGLEEIIFALKSRRKALDLKLESTVCQDKNEIFYFGDCENALELNELSVQDIGELLLAIQNSQKYDKVLIDIGNSLQEKDIAVLSLVNRLIAVIDTSEVAEVKWKRYLDTLHVIEELKKTDICSKMIVFINKARKDSFLPDQIMQVRVRGSLPQLENGTYAGVIDRLAGLESLQNIR